MPIVRNEKLDNRNFQASLLNYKGCDKIDDWYRLWLLVKSLKDFNEWKVDKIFFFTLSVVWHLVHKIAVPRI